MSSVRRTPTLRRWLDGAPRGWTVVGASVIVNAISDGTWFYGFAVFFLPISRDLALSRAATSFPFTIKGIIVALLGPPIGVWIDRAGPSQRALGARRDERPHQFASTSPATTPALPHLRRGSHCVHRPGRSPRFNPGVQRVD